MTTSEAEIRSVEARLQRAVLERDLDTLDGIVADDALFTGPDGTTIDKAADLQMHRSGRLRVHAFVVRDLTVRVVSADAAEVDLTAHLRVELDGNLQEGDFRYHRRYVRREDGWQVAFARADSP